MISILSTLIVGLVVGIFFILSASIFADCTEDLKDMKDKPHKPSKHFTDP